MTDGAKAAAFRAIPAIDRMLEDPAWADAPEIGHGARRDACRAVVQALREAIAAGDAVEAGSLHAAVSSAVAHARADVRPVLRRVINATGVILHTNLGRAPLPAAALKAIADLAGGYVNVELDLDGGQRDNRLDKVAAAFSRVLGCPDVAVANNNAAATFLALSALAGDGRKVAISRGELVEIGGSFRMPEIMEASGAAMIEVGTTNRTWPKDYSAALDAGASVLLKVHQSNFAMVGFTHDVSVEELVALARPAGALVVHDLGSGQLRGDPTLGNDSVRRSLDAGVDLVLFSGDKLLGGPQCGIAAGRRDLVDRLRSSPVMRMVRPDKLTLVALEATLLAWERDPSGGEIPAAAMLARSEGDLRVAATALAADLREACGDRLEAEVVPGSSTPGGGTAPLVQLPSYAVALRFPGEGASALADRLRRGDPPVVARVEDDRVHLDVRTLLDGDAAQIVAALRPAPPA